MLNGPPVWVLGGCQPCIQLRLRAVVRWSVINYRIRTPGAKAEVSAGVE